MMWITVIVGKMTIMHLTKVIFIILLAISLKIQVSGMSLYCLYPKCPSCSDYLDLMCGSNGITYPNRCWVDCYNEMPECEPIHIIRKGWCPMTIRPKRSTKPPTPTMTPSTPLPTCNVTACRCPSAYNPICGSDGVTYSNTCYYRCARRCFHDLEFIKCGLCSWTYPPHRLCLGRTNT